MNLMSLAPPPDTLSPGFRLDRYELLWPLAEGGMASVWLARLHGKRGFEKLVAVKTILPKFASDPRFQSMFLDEARIASGIEHTNVARVLDLGEEHGVLYIAMEWIDGDALSKLQRVLARAGVPFPQGVVLRILADACAGLHAAHELKGRDGNPLHIVHRDVSPQNILVSTEGVAKIIDFGVAKARDCVSEDTSSGSLKGKIQYMAPEQALGKAVDRRVDVWAIGAMLYYFFSGRKVFESESELATLQLLTSGTPPDPLPSSVPPVVAEIIAGTLKFNREERTPTMDVVRRQLEDAMVQLGCIVRAEDIAAFLKTYADDRAVARRTTVTKALQAADARAALEEERPSVASASGLIGVQSRSPSSLVGEVGETRVQLGPVERSSGTLGVAAMNAPAPPPPAKGGISTPIALAFVAAVAVLGVLYLRPALQHPSSSARAGGPTAPASAPGPSPWATIAPPTVASVPVASPGMGNPVAANPLAPPLPATPPVPTVAVPEAPPPTAAERATAGKPTSHPSTAAGGGTTASKRPGKVKPAGKGADQADDGF